MAKKNDIAERLPEGVTLEKLKALEAKHGLVYPIRQVDGDKVYRGLFRKPTLADMSAAASLGNDQIAAGRLVYESCKLAVDPGVEDNEEVLLAFIKGVNKLFRSLEAEVGEPFGAAQ